MWIHGREHVGGKEDAAAELHTFFLKPILCKKNLGVFRTGK